MYGGLPLAGAQYCFFEVLPNQLVKVVGFAVGFTYLQEPKGSGQWLVEGGSKKAKTCFFKFVANISTPNTTLISGGFDSVGLRYCLSRLNLNQAPVLITPLLRVKSNPLNPTYRI